MAAMNGNYSRHRVDRCSHFKNGKQVFHIEETDLEARVFQATGRFHVVQNMVTHVDLNLHHVVSVKSRDRRMLFQTSSDGKSGIRIRFTNASEHRAFYEVITNYVPIDDVGENSSQSYSFDSPRSTQRLSQFSSSQSYSPPESQQSALNFSQLNSSQTFPTEAPRQSPRRPFSRCDSFSNEPFLKTDPFSKSAMDCQESAVFGAPNAPPDAPKSPRTFSRCNSFSNESFLKTERQENSVFGATRPRSSNPTESGLKSAMSRREQHRQNWSGFGVSFPPPSSENKKPDNTSAGKFRAPQISVLGDPAPFSLRSETRADRHAMFRAFQYIRMDPAFNEMLDIMIVEIPQLASFFSSLKRAVLDDVVDQINYYYTTWLITLCAIVVTTKQVLGAPIHCLISAEFPSGWVNYVHSYCFVTGTYDVKDEVHFREHGYYQWVPFILAAMAILCYAPHFFWRVIQKSSNLDLDSVVSDSITARGLIGKDRADKVDKIVQYTRRYLNAPNFGFLGFSARFGVFSSITYVFSKILNCLNLLMQIYLINYHVGGGDYMWGYKLIQSGFDHKDPSNPNPFPRLTHCKFEVRDIGFLRPYETDCIIMINIINEKIFLIIWMWFHFVAVVTFFNLLYTIFVLFVPAVRRCVIGNHLRMKTIKKNSRYYEVYADKKEGRLLEEFADKAMSIDGVQLIRFISSRAGGLVAHEVIFGIWKDFMDARQN